MDYFQSKFIDKPELLSSVKRNNLQANSTVIIDNKERYLQQIEKYYNFTKVNGTFEPSSLLREVPEKVTKKYSQVNYSSVLKHTHERPIENDTQNITIEKPVIKIIVIPNREKVQTRKSKRQKHYLKLQNSVSNQESSICTQNSHSSHEKLDRVHAINTTRSLKFQNKHILRYKRYEENILHCKQLLESLNMEIKRKREKKKKKVETLEMSDRCYDCACIENSRNKVLNVKSNTSRVRIYGSVGVTGDDRYVMDCGASVDDNPIHSINYIEDNPEVFQVFLDNIQPRSHQRDFKMQTEEEDVIGFPLAKNKQRMSGVSQGTQVNLNTRLPINNNNSYQIKDQHVQCDCFNTVISRNQIETKSNAVECDSPLIIISVYPKPETQDIVKTVACYEEINNLDGNVISSPFNPERIQKANPRRTPTTSPRRTPATSPKRTAATNGTLTPASSLKRTSETISSKNKEKTTLPPTSIFVSRSPSPVKNVNRRNLESNIKQDKPKVIRAFKRDDSPNYQSSLVSKNVQRIDRKTITKDQNNLRKERANKTINKNTIRPSENKNQLMLAKQALVNNFTKKITDNMNMKPKNDGNDANNATSKLTVNIDNEHEHYGVSLNQGKYTTDFTIRRNKISSQRPFDYPNGIRSTSPQNNKLVDNKRRKKLSQPTTSNEYDGEYLSGLKVCDSLEILHRRETSQSFGISKPHPNAHNSNKRRSAPTKHYKGDDCNLPNPIERDKQIRELLGIDSHVLCSSKIYQSQDIDRQEDKFLRCLMKRRVKRNNPISEELRESICQILQNQSTSKCVEEKSTQHDQPPIQGNVYQQLVLYKNIQVFLKEDHCNIQKPIILSRQQYEKLKQTIRDTLNKKISVGKINKWKKPSIVYVGIIREKSKRTIIDPKEKGVQERKNEASSTNIQRNSFLFNWMKQNSVNNTKEELPDLLTFDKIDNLCNNSRKSKDFNLAPLRQTMSSIELSCTNAKPMQYSKINLQSENTSYLGNPRSDSLITIYKVSGPKHSPTPNLGTSLVDVVSDTKSVKYLMAPRETKPRKPFLQRLISCLLVHTTKDPVSKVSKGNIPLTTSGRSSADSYHISSSLGGMEITSSIYDTSASFYSNHSVQINNKMKRSFFSSVRGFLTSRKS